MRHKYCSLETSDKWVRQSWHNIWVQGSCFGSLRCGAYSKQIAHCTTSFAVLATADILLWCLLHVKISLPLVGQDLLCKNLSIMTKRLNEYLGVTHNQMTCLCHVYGVTLMRILDCTLKFFRIDESSNNDWLLGVVCLQCQLCTAETHIDYWFLTY